MKQIFTLLLLTAMLQYSQAQMAHLSSHAVSLKFRNQLLQLEAVDNMNVWGLAAASEYDTIAAVHSNNMQVVRSTDGGIHWQTHDIPGTSYNDSARLANFWPVSGTTAYVAFYEMMAGTGGYIKRTTDGGSTWQDVNVGGNNFVGGFLNFIYFFHPDTGIAMGDPVGGYFEIYRTTDGGSSWTRVPQANIPAPQANEYGLTSAFTFCNNNFNFTSSTSRTIYTTDRGLTWQAAASTIPLTSGQANMSGRIIDNGEMIFDTYNNNNTYYYTTDLGVSKSTKTYPASAGITFNNPISPRSGNVLMAGAYHMSGGVIDSMYIYQCKGSAATPANWQRRLAVSSYDYAFSYGPNSHAHFYNEHLGWLIGYWPYDINDSTTTQIIFRYDDCIGTALNFNMPDTVCHNVPIALSDYAWPAGGVFTPYAIATELTIFTPTDFFPLISEQDSIFNLQYQYESGGCYSEAFDVVYVEECAPTAIDESNDTYIRIWPNPAKDVLHLPDARNIASARIFDLSGRLCISIENPTSTIPVSSLSSGTYLLQLRMNGSAHNSKLLIE